MLRRISFVYRRYLAATAAMLLLVTATPANAADRANDEAGFKPIFNGRDLDGWEGKEGFWSVRDGAITGQTTAENPTKGNTFLIWQGGDLDDFVLRARFRIESGNSGIQFRSKHLGDYVVAGYQADIDAGGSWLGTCYGERFGGVLAQRGTSVRYSGDQAEKSPLAEDTGKFLASLKPSEWNEYELEARGNHIVQRINGVVVCELVDGRSNAQRAGILALQLHAGPPMLVQFKDIRLKRLPLEDKKKIVMVAGTKSHGYGAHEFNAGCLLMKKWLDDAAPDVLTTVYLNGWPKDPTAFDNANGVVLFMNGGGGHPINNRLEAFDALMKRGVGLACLHYAVEVPAGKPGHYFLQWIGGYFETFWSVNPHWTLEKTTLAKGHPITRGVRPFEIRDEWYYHMRFREQDSGVVPILTATPPDNTRREQPSERGGNPHVAKRKGMAETLAWAVEREDGGRGFGFTGGHDHWNWGHDDFRKLVLNAVVWISGADVPEGGIVSPTPTLAELEANQDYPVPANFDRAALEQRLQKMNSNNGS